MTRGGPPGADEREAPAVDAIVLGGGEGGAVDPACRFKADLEVAGRSMLDRVVDALVAASTVDRVLVLRHPEQPEGAWADRVETVLPFEGALVDKLVAGARVLGDERPILIATADVPALTAGDVDSFVEAALASGAEVAYPVISREALERAFPGGRRTYVRLRSAQATGGEQVADGRQVTGGNLMLATAVSIERGRDIGRRLFDARKSPVAMARVLGPGFVLRLAFGRLDVPGLESRLSALLGGPVAAVVTDRAAIGMDVDKPSDRSVVEAVLATSPEVSPEAFPGTSSGDVHREE